MPTYTYECKKCSHKQDVFHGMNATPRVKCEECGGICRKLLGTGAGLIFKGSGFYETDYKRSGNGKGEKKSEGAKSESSSSESASSESSGKSESTKSESAKSDNKGSTKSEGKSGGESGKSKASGDK